MPPVINLDAAGDEDDAGAGGRPDGQRDGQENQQQLLQIRNISSPLPLQPCLYLDDLDIVAGHHELRVVCHEVAGVPRLGGVVLPVPPVMIYPVSALLL